MLVGDAPRSDAYRFQILLPFLVGLSSGSTTFLQDALYRHNRRGLVVGSFVISCRSAIAWTKCRSWLFQGGKHRFTYTPKKLIAQDSSRVKSSRYILEPITILKNLSRWARSRTKTMTSESEKSPNGKGTYGGQIIGRILHDLQKCIFFQVAQLPLILVVVLCYI